MNARRPAVTFGSIGPLVACILHTSRQKGAKDVDFTQEIWVPAAYDNRDFGQQLGYVSIQHGII
jgi:hypothetical protein